MPDEARESSDPRVASPPFERPEGHRAPDDTPDSPSQAWNAAWGRIAELREYAEHFAQAKLDTLKLAARKAGVWAVAGVLALVAACVFVVTAIVMLVSGIAHGLGVLFGNRVWLGELVTGLVIVLGLAGAIVGGMIVTDRASKKRTLKKYEQRKRNQQDRFGHDVREQGRQDGPH